MHSISMKLSKYGTLVSLLVLTAGLAVILYNSRINYISEYITYIGQQLTKTSFALFAETIIGVMIFETFSKTQKDR